VPARRRGIDVGGCGVRRLPSGRYHARFTEPGTVRRWVNAPATFETKRAAEWWVARERSALEDRKAEVAGGAG
jgi:hypothetical protein